VTCFNRLNYFGFITVIFPIFFRSGGKAKKILFLFGFRGVPVVNKPNFVLLCSLLISISL
jgi:hypothetical protein